jgi:hypothetical protein
MTAHRYRVRSAGNELLDHYRQTEGAALALARSIVDSVHSPVAWTAVDHWADDKWRCIHRLTPRETS